MRRHVTPRRAGAPLLSDAAWAAAPAPCVARARGLANRDPAGPQPSSFRRVDAARPRRLPAILPRRGDPRRLRRRLAIAGSRRVWSKTFVPP